MSNEEIKELLQIFNESGVGELELQRGKDKLRIRRAGDFPAVVNQMQTHAPLPAPEAAPAAEAPRNLRRFTLNLRGVKPS